MPSSTPADTIIAQAPPDDTAPTQHRHQRDATAPGARFIPSQSAALTGASRAFQAAPSAPTPAPNTYSGHNGALAAATKAEGRVGNTGSALPHGADSNTSFTAASRTAAVQVFPLPGHRSATTSATNSPILGPIGRIREFAASAERLAPAHNDLQIPNRQSPSYIAASLAASRATPAPLSPTLPNAASNLRGRVTPASPSPVLSNPASILRLRTPQDVKDETSIPATRKLVAMFEAGKTEERPSQKPVRQQQQHTASTVVRPTQPILSPVPVRPAKPPPEPTKPVARRPRPSPSPSSLSSEAVSPIERKMVRNQNAKSKPALPPSRSTKTNPAPTSKPKPKPAPKPVQSPRVKPPPVLPRLNTQPQTLRSGRPAVMSPESGSDSDAYASAEDKFPRPPTPPRARRRPSPPPPRTTRRPTTETTSVLPPKTDSPPHVVPPLRPSSAISRRPAHPITVNSAARLKPQLTADSLADAMVASSLASSRVPSPSKERYMSPFARPGAHKTYSFSLLVPSSATSPTGASTPLRPLSPMKSGGMRQTMRRTESSGGSGGSGRERSKSRDRRGHGHHGPGFLVRKHPHKHAEGDRRRWRDSVTPAERKRYEGVWAANRGILMDGARGADEEVHAFAVRDLWNRSGLGVATLEQVWDLVAGGGKPAERRRSLRRDEFVVGLWLVDQSLKGRRLPVEVSDSVWSSARNLPAGIRAR